MNFNRVNRYAFFLLALIGSVVFARAADAPNPKSIPIAKIKHSGPVDFEKEILPILKNNCLACHNQTKPKGGLVLETPQTILKGGDAGPAVVPSKPAESLLLKAASHQDSELIMPPPDNKVAAMPLKSEELALVQLWIEQGGKGEVRASAPIVWQPIPSALSAIYAAALTRDGQFAACGRANQIFVYHLPSGRLATRLNDPQVQKTSNAGAAHRDTVNSIAFSPDGELLASGGYREVKLWRIKPAEKFKLPTGNDLIATSSDGKWIAAASTNGEVRLLDQRGKLARTIPSSGGLVAALRFAPGTNVLVVARSNAVELASVPAGTTVAKLEMPAAITSLACVGPSSLAVACDDDVIRILDPTTNGGALTVTKELKPPTSVMFLDSSPASTNQLVAGSSDGSVRVWNVAKAEVALEVKHGSALTALAMRPDGKHFATAGGPVAKLWKITDTKMIAEMKGDGRASWLVGDKEREQTFAKSEIDFRKSALQAAETNQVTVAARQKKAAETNAALTKIAGEKQTAFTNAVAAQHEAEKALDDLGPEVRTLMDALAAAEKESTNAAALAKAAKDGTDKSKAEKLAVEANTKSNLLVEAKVALENLPAETKAKQKLTTEKLTAANKTITDVEKEFKKADQTRSTAEHELQLATDAVQKAEAVTTKAKTALSTTEAESTQAEKALEAAKEALAQTEQPIRAIAFAPDNLTFVTAGDDGSIRTWSAETGAAFDAFSTTLGAARNLATLGSLIIVAGEDSSAAWDIDPRWALERVIGTGDASSPLADRVNALRFTADGRQLFTGGGEPTRGGEIKLWRTKDGVLVREFANVHSDSVLALDISADGKYLASGAADRFAKVVDLSTGKVVKAYEGHSHHVLGVAWRRDGRTLLTAGADNVAKVWDVATGERRKNIEGFAKEVTAAAFIGVSDEAVLSAGDGQVMFVKGNGDKVRSFTGATDYVNAASATPDGGVLVGGGADGILRAWNGKDGKLLVEFPPR